MKSIKFFLWLIFFPVLAFSQGLSTYDLTTEHKTNPIGTDVLRPRLSWKLNGTGNNIMQTAYSLRVATDPKFSGSKTVWQSGKITSDESILISYKGPDLNPCQRYYWQVKVWDNKGRESKWSQTAYWETGLLKQENWKAKWIEMESDTNRYSPSPHFRKEFSIEKNIAKAVVYVTSHGFYELHMNGKKVGDQVFTPGWTSYGKRLQYQVYDVTGQLVKGFNIRFMMLQDRLPKGRMQ
jgi:alpha-L-rhamnosidase